jgi:hypothetical protein
MNVPYEIMILTVEEVLLDIYEGELSSKSTEEATRAFALWLTEHNAHYYTGKKTNGTDAVQDAILATIRNKKTLCVLASCPEFENDN